jgi:hypothetical protein
MTQMISLHITRSIRISSFLIPLVAFGMGSLSMAQTENSHRTCRQWISEVTQSPKGAPATSSAAGKSSITITPLESDPWGVASLSEPERLAAIQCFLTLENDLRPGAFGGAMRFDVSQTFSQPPVNLAALYAISYIYTGRYNHAAAVALRGDDASSTDAAGNYVTKPSAVHKAYRAYREWFAQVRKLGIARAQGASLQPLDGSGLRWY